MAALYFFARVVPLLQGERNLGMGVDDRASHATDDTAEPRDHLVTPDQPEAGPVSILIVDELQIFRDGLRVLLASDARLTIVADVARPSSPVTRGAAPSSTSRKCASSAR